MSSDFKLNLRSSIRYILVMLWICVFQFNVQFFMHLTSVEFIAYSSAGLFVFVIFFKYVRLLRSPYAFFGATLMFSFILGLMPYDIRLYGIALFLFDWAKDPVVTYFVDPYMNVDELVLEFVFPAIHFLLMLAITATYSKSDDEVLGVVQKWFDKSEQRDK
jgi:hypothetical protein